MIWVWTSFSSFLGQADRAFSGHESDSVPLTCHCGFLHDGLAHFND